MGIGSGVALVAFARVAVGVPAPADGETGFHASATAGDAGADGGALAVGTANRGCLPLRLGLRLQLAFKVIYQPCPGIGLVMLQVVDHLRYLVVGVAVNLPACAACNSFQPSEYRAVKRCIFTCNTRNDLPRFRCRLLRGFLAYCCGVVARLVAPQMLVCQGFQAYQLRSRCAACCHV